MEGEIFFVGRRADGSPSAMDVLPQGDVREAVQAAREFLNEHQSCGLVELWSGERHLATLRREDEFGAATFTDPRQGPVSRPQA